MKAKLTWMHLGLTLLLMALVSTACSSPNAAAQEDGQSAIAADAATVEFKLVTTVSDGRLAFVGSGGDIDGVINPDLVVKTGDVVRVVLENGDGMGHDVLFPDFGVSAPAVMGLGDTAEVVFEIKSGMVGSYAYFCTFPGHRQAGQEGRLVISAP